MSIAKINAEGQIKIPPEFLKVLNLTPGDEIDFQVDPSGRVFIERVEPSQEVIPPKLIELREKIDKGEKLTLDDLYGVLRQQGTQALSVKEMDEAVKDYVAASDRRTISQSSENP
jgi:bifunctional DNA-binding transcriptional regulator/antitoxin component of YhaV-PrlF toxin-antitoxin module